MKRTQNNNNNKKNTYSMLFSMQRYFQNNKKTCQLCECQERELDYKNATLLKGFTSAGGRILSRRLTAVCAKHQRRLSKSIKRARIMSLLPFCD